VSEFTYLLVAREEGQGRIAPFLLRYRNGLSDRVESVPVEGSLLEIGPPRVAFLSRPWVWAAAGALFLLAAASWIASASRRIRRRHAASEGGSGENEFTRAIADLKGRCEAADSRLWLRDAEKLCLGYLCRDLGVSKVRNVRFEAALGEYLARRPGREPGEAESWTKLRDLFHEARYAGGRKEPHELREACRHLKICLSPAESAKLEKA
jgi:hypothetical protein